MYILHLLKVLMYYFHYDYIKNKYDNNLRLLFTDTDSLMYQIKTEVVYEGFSNSKKLFDFCNYSTKTKVHDDSNKLRFCKMKVVTSSSIICSLNCSIQKMYHSQQLSHLFSHFTFLNSFILSKNIFKVVISCVIKSSLKSSHYCLIC